MTTADDYEKHVAEAQQATMPGWDFSWLEGRAHGEGPSGDSEQQARALPYRHWIHRARPPVPDRGTSTKVFVTLSAKASQRFGCSLLNGLPGFRVIWIIVRGGGA